MRLCTSWRVRALTTNGNTRVVDRVEQGGAIGAEATLLGGVAGCVASIELVVVSVCRKGCEGF